LAGKKKKECACTTLARREKRRALRKKRQPSALKGTANATRVRDGGGKGRGGGGFCYVSRVAREVLGQGGKNGKTWGWSNEIPRRKRFPFDTRGACVKRKDQSLLLKKKKSRQET